MKLLNSENTKTRKGEKLGWRTYGLHLAPHTLAGKNVCPSASAGCAAACLNTAGRGIMRNVQAARIAKTKFFFEDRAAFLAQLYKEITSAIKSAKRAGFNPCFRLNLTSDLPWENLKHDGKSMMEHFPDVPFYDYTKIQSRMIKFLAGGMPPNYHLTFSRSECNQMAVDKLLNVGANVAVVFRGSLPDEWQGAPVIDGDSSDLRFLDPSPSVVGLVEKGLAKKDETGFVVG